MSRKHKKNRKFNKKGISKHMEYQQWEWDDKNKTYIKGGGIKCHTGNTIIYQEPNGGKLFIGGWSNSAVVTNNTHVIDLTGAEDRLYSIPTAFDENSKKFLQFTNQVKGWLSLPFPDYNTPSWINSYEKWFGITTTIQDILKEGTDVLVACQGGHGRSGLFCAIVGYILNVTSDRSWSSPVEKIRKIHCDLAVETIAQEKFVYDILGLNIQISHVYATPTTVTTFGSDLKKCPICHTESIYVHDFGMCMGCKNKYAVLAEERTDLTEEDLKVVHPVHTCDKGEHCLGIWRASKCGHCVHDMIIYDGLCENCAWEQAQKERASKTEAKKKDDETKFTEDENLYGTCAICQRRSMFGKKFGVCFDCSDELKKSGQVDYVHNTTTDPYRAVPHHCEALVCFGVVTADVCGHTVHNQEIEDGKCPYCLSKEKVDEKNIGV